MSRYGVFVRCWLGVTSLAVLLPMGAGSLAGPSAATRPRPAAGEFVSYRSAGSMVRARVDAALARNRWVGELHSAAMKDAIKVRISAGSTDQERAEACQNTLALVERYVPRTEAAAGVRLANASARDFARTIVGRLKQCRSSSIMNVFGDTAGAGGMSSSIGTDDITGAFMNYDFPLGDSPSDLENNVYDVLATAYSHGIPSGDFEVLAAEGSLSISSGWEWDGVDYWYTTPAARPFSIFARPVTPRMPKWAKIAGADVGGCLTAAAATWAEAAIIGAAAPPVGAAAYAASCGIWGIGTSAVTWWTL